MRTLTNEEMNYVSGGLQDGPFPAVNGKNVSIVIFAKEDITEEHYDNQWGEGCIYKEERSIQLTITGLQLS